MTAALHGVLEDRVRAALLDRSVQPKRMFGGLAFLLNGNMLCCVSAKGLMARISPLAEAHALKMPHAAPCLGSGRRLPGFILVQPPGVAEDEDLHAWLALALAHVTTLPPKAPKTSATRRRA